MNENRPVLRYPGTARTVLQQHVGDWPKGALGPSARHARGHWRQALNDRQPCPAGAEGAAILAFIGRLANDVQWCDQCQRGTGGDRTPPEQWVWWALNQKAVTRQIVRALVGGRGKRTPKPRIEGTALPGRPRIVRPPAPDRL